MARQERPLTPAEAAWFTHQMTHVFGLRRSTPAEYAATGEIVICAPPAGSPLHGLLVDRDDGVIVEIIGPAMPEES